MAKVDLNTFGGASFPIGNTGEIADQENAQIMSRTNEGATVIDFGVAVCRGTIGNGTCKAMAADADPIIGISVRNPERPASSDGNTTVNHKQYDSVPILVDGLIFAKAFEDVREGDQVLALTASAGGLAGSKGGAAGAGRIDVPGAVWETTTTSGQVGRVRLKGTGFRRTTT